MEKFRKFKTYRDFRVKHSGIRDYKIAGTKSNFSFRTRFLAITNLKGENCNKRKLFE